MRWLPYALLCSVFIASADFFVKLASNKIASSMDAGLRHNHLCHRLDLGQLFEVHKTTHPHRQYARHPAFTRTVHLALLMGLILTIAGVTLIVFR